MPLILGYGAVKGAIVASVTLAIGTTFVQSIIVAVISGALGVAGMVLAAAITNRRARQHDEVLDEIRTTTEAVAGAVTDNPKPGTPRRRRSDYPK